MKDLLMIRYPQAEPARVLELFSIVTVEIGTIAAVFMFEIIFIYKNTRTHPHPQDLLGNNHVAGPVQSSGSLFSTRLPDSLLLGKDGKLVYWDTNQVVALCRRELSEMVVWRGECLHSSRGPHSSGP